MRCKERQSAKSLVLIIVLSALIFIQVYVMTLQQGHAEYVGIAFGTEAEVGYDAADDIWEVQKVRYNYIANNQTKPEVDLRGLLVTRGLNEPEWSSEYELRAINSINNKTNYIYNYSFSIPIININNISYTFKTNQTFASSAIAFYNWTAGQYNNVSAVQNITPTLISAAYYSSQQIRIQFNISHSEEFIFWFNISFEFWSWVDQRISLSFNSVSPGNASLINNLIAWIFLDTNGDDKLNYALLWKYGSGTFLYSIGSNSFDTEGVWIGTYNKTWIGTNWRDLNSVFKKDIGVLETNRLNITIPSYLINLTSTVHYAVWSQKIEPLYDWWDALPDDPNWQISIFIPGFQFAFLGLSLLIVALMGLIIKRNFLKLSKRV